VLVPENVSVIGIDDLDSSASFFTPLTTIKLPTDKLAKEAWKLLKAMLDGSMLKTETPVVVKPEIVVRKSSRNLTKGNRHGH